MKCGAFHEMQHFSYEKCHFSWKAPLFIWKALCFSWKAPHFMKSSAFHMKSIALFMKICRMHERIHENLQDFMWNPPDFERPIARNGNAYVSFCLSIAFCHFDDIITFCVCKFPLANAVAFCLKLTKKVLSVWLFNFCCLICLTLRKLKIY